jgi:hypothetical protein
MPSRPETGIPGWRQNGRRLVRAEAQTFDLPSSLGPPGLIPVFPACRRQCDLPARAGLDSGRLKLDRDGGR